MAVSEEYINIKEALHRIGGSMDLYKKLLNSFTGTDYVAPIEEALNAGTMENASHQIHTLKGVAANLSLIKLAAIAGDLEHKVKNGVDHTDALQELKSIYLTTSEQIPEVS